jgi:predicted enzyme related to lactoylglutathione lyase
MKDYWASVKVGRAEFWMMAVETQEKRERAYSSFVVDDIKAEVAELKKKGVRFQLPEKIGPGTKIEGSIARGAMGAAAQFKDSEGNMLMLWENPQ